MPTTDYTYGLQPLHVRRIRIAPGVKDAVARHAESKPDSRLARELADNDYYDTQDLADETAYATARALMDAE